VNGASQYGTVDDDDNEDDEESPQPHDNVQQPATQALFPQSLMMVKCFHRL